MGGIPRPRKTLLMLAKCNMIVEYDGDCILLCNFTVNLNVRLLDGWSVGRSVCHKCLKGEGSYTCQRSSRSTFEGLIKLGMGACTGQPLLG